MGSSGINALYISLHKLATTGQLSRNAQIIDRNKVTSYLNRLYYYLTKYNIDVYIMGTKDHMSDYASRYPDKTLDQLFQDDTLPTRTLPKDLPMCTRTITLISLTHTSSKSLERLWGQKWHHH